jgi:hypothetical protein
LDQKSDETAARATAQKSTDTANNSVNRRKQENGAAMRQMLAWGVRKLSKMSQRAPPGCD